MVITIEKVNADIKNTQLKLRKTFLEILLLKNEYENEKSNFFKKLIEDNIKTFRKKEEKLKCRLNLLCDVKKYFFEFPYGIRFFDYISDKKLICLLETLKQSNKIDDLEFEMSELKVKFDRLKRCVKNENKN